MDKEKISSLDVEELACVITGLDYDKIDADTSVIESAMYDQFGIDLESFQEILSRLLPLIDVGKSPLTKKRYKGFSDPTHTGWILKVEI